MASLAEKLARITACQPHSLVECLNLVQAVFGCTATTETLSELYDHCILLLSSSQLSEAVTAAAAALVFLSNPYPSELILRQYTQRVFLHLASATDDQPVSSQLLHHLTAVLAAGQAWGLAREILQCAQISLEGQASNASAKSGSQPANCSVSHQQQLEIKQQISVQLPIATASLAVKEIAAAALSYHMTQQEQRTDTHPAVQQTLQICTGPLFATACQLLASPAPALRKASFQQLLPGLLSAAEAISSECHQQCIQQLWQQCLEMIAAPALPRRMGLAVLLQHWSAWSIQPPSATSADAAEGLSSSEQFWSLLRSCLVDSEALNRKRALRLLQLLLPEELLRQQPVWGVFMALYELLDEFSPHLVKASWPMISQLHAVSPEFATEDADTDVALSNQLNLLKVTSKEHSQQQQQQQGARCDLPMAFCWTAVIWTRALEHKNLQVQRMALKTLLKRHWTPVALSQLPPSFLTTVLLPALLSPVHHKIQAAGGLSATGGVVEASSASPNTAAAAASPNSEPQQTPAMATAHPVGPGSSGSSALGFNVATQAAELLSKYVTAVGPAVAREVLSDGLDMLAKPGVDLPRSGLLAVLRALAAAAAAAVGAQGSMLQDLTAAEAGAYVEASLSKMQALLARLVTYAGQRFRINCYNMLLTIAAAVAPLGPCSLSTAARLLQNMPAWMQGSGGPLNHNIRAWLLGGGLEKLENSSSNSPDSGSGSELLQDSCTAMWQQYFSSSIGNGLEQQQQQQWHAEAKDYVSYRTQADAWLRVVLACSDTLQQTLTAAAVDLADRTEQLVSRSYLAPAAAERTLIMLLTIFECAESAGRVAVEAGEQLPAVTAVAVKLAEAVAGSLSACLASFCCCYRCKPADLAAGSSSSGDNSSSGVRYVGLSGSAWAAAARAEAAPEAAAAAAVLLAMWQANSWAGNDSSSSEVSNGVCTAAAAAAAAAGSVSNRRMSVLLLLLGKLAQVGEQIAVEALPSVTAAAGAVQGGRLATAAAAEQSRASAVRVLCHAALGITRVVLICHDIPLHTLACTPITWIDAVLRETATARSARTAWQAAAADGSSSKYGDPWSGWIEDMNWKCLDAVMMLAAVATSSKSSRLAGLEDHHQAAAAVAAASPGSATTAAAASLGFSGLSGPFALPAGVLSADVISSVFCQGLEALQWSSGERGSDLVELLRCIKRVWVNIVQDQRLQVTVQESLQAAGALTDNHSSSTPPLVNLTSALSNSLLDVLRSSKKRPQIMYSLITNTALLPELCIFNPEANPELVALHEGPGAPLKRFIQGLLQQGCKGSPRLMLALGLQLGTYLCGNAGLLVWYGEELRQLLMFGVAAQVGAEELTMALPTVEETLERSLLSEPLDPELQAAYTLTDIGPRVAVCCGLYHLALQAGLVEDRTGRHSSSSSSQRDEQWVAEVEAAGVQLWQSWLQATIHDPVLCGERFKVGSDIHRLKVRAWQGLATVANFISSSRQRDTAAEAVQELLAQLCINNPPSIKQYQEAIIAHLLLQHPGLLKELLLPQFASVEKGSTATGSHILIAVQVALHSEAQVQTRVLPQLVKQLLPWTNHHTHNIRTFAQLGFCAVLDTKPLDVWEGWREGLGAGGVEVLGELLRFMHDNADFQRFRRAMGAGILSWSPVGVTSPRRIFSSALHLAGAEESPVTFEGVPETLMDRLITFLAAERAKLREAAVDRVAGYEGGSTAAPASSSSAANAAADGSSAANAGGPVVDFQRKVTPHERAALMADVLDELDAADGVGGGPAGIERHDLIVVASLISKVPNLGGLARTAEVLGAGALVLSDKRVAAEAGFTSVSVTAERWVPLVEVKEAVLIPWLAKKQAEGYTLVGLEQTAESTCLPNYKFPSKTVLVLGREKEGIPPEIIAMLDATVEIPQLGVIRSLNVHVSGAIAMYEYAKQQLPACSS